MASSAATLASAGPYSAQQVTLFALLAIDIVINSTADAQGEPLTRFLAILVLVAQLVVRIACFFTTIGLLATSGAWHDEFLLRYCGVFVASLFSLFLCLLLRVSCVTLASFPTEFPTVLDYWGTAYPVALIGHVLLSLVFYYTALTSAFSMGSARLAPTPAGRRQIRPSTYAAVQLATTSHGRR